MKSKDSKVDKQYLIGFINDIKADYVSLHNQKDNTAWAAIALFAFISLMILNYGKEFIFKGNLLILLTFSLIIFIFAILIWCFIKIQFKLKSAYTDIIYGCHRLLIKFLSNPDKHIQVKLEFESTQASSVQIYGIHFLPQALIQEIIALDQSGVLRIYRRKIKTLTRTIILFICFVCYLFIWFPVLSKIFNL
ncbi:hypothetical protein ACFL4L_02670 [bacterium]